MGRGRRHRRHHAAREARDVSPRRIVIVGAGQAGGWAAQTLRKEGFAGEVLLLGEEAHPPHERPPLSKAMLAGTAEPASTHLLRPDVLAAIDWRRDTRVEAIDRAAKRVRTARGDHIGYDTLILATGTRVRRLAVPGAELPHVHYLRTIDDALALRARLVPGARVAIIGGGWIGLEVAATSRKRGADVTVIETQERLCARAAPPLVSQHLAALHVKHGVAIRLGVGVGAITATGITLLDGGTVPADLVVIGIGVVPNVELAQDAGLAVDNGIVVDASARTGDRDIFAAGDCARVPLARLGRTLRLESWAHAQNHGIAAARAALGLEIRYDDTPWFWSDQYDLNLQLLGAPSQWSAPVLRGDPAHGPASAFFLTDDRLDAVIAFNAPRDLRFARKLLEARTPVRAEQLADPALALAKLG